MTTIAWKDGWVAWDSLVTTDDDRVMIRHYNKHFRHDGAHFFVAGTLADVHRLFAGYTNPDAPAAPDTMALVVSSEGLCILQYNEDLKRFTREPVGDTYAIGSGADFAIGAMEVGMPARRAVEAAQQHDLRTGGEIRFLRFEELLCEENRR